MTNTMKIVLLVALVSFTGQMLAIANSCEHMVSGTTMDHASIDHSLMDHSNIEHEKMNHTMMSHDTSEPTNCCLADCVCPASLCSASNAIETSAISDSDLKQLSALITNSQQQPSNTINHVYRPPILV